MRKELHQLAVEHWSGSGKFVKVRTVGDEAKVSIAPRQFCRCHTQSVQHRYTYVSTTTYPNSKSRPLAPVRTKHPCKPSSTGAQSTGQQFTYIHNVQSTLSPAAIQLHPIYPQWIPKCECMHAPQEHVNVMSLKVQSLTGTTNLEIDVSNKRRHRTKLQEGSTKVQISDVCLFNEQCAAPAA